MTDDKRAPLRRVLILNLLASVLALAGLVLFLTVTRGGGVVLILLGAALFGARLVIYGRVT